MNAIFGKKVGMTRYFTESGESIAVTLLECAPNVVFQVKTPEKDGYKALQIGIGEQKPQRVSRAQIRHFAKAAKGIPAVVKEIRQDRYLKDKEFNVGDEIKIEGLFNAGSRVDIIGTSIGKGFAGVMKRHHMKGAQTNSHGTHEYFRHGGSIGCRKFPGRVFKNKRMPGHMGMERVVQEGVEVVATDPSKNLLILKGSVPGPKSGIVFIRSSLKCQ